MLKARYIFALMVIAVVTVATLAAQATTKHGSSYKEGTGAFLYVATIRCDNTLTEDSAAHLKLVRYNRRADGTLALTYKCVGGF